MTTFTAMLKSRGLHLALLIGSTSLAHATSPIINHQFITPDPFGYFIGDLLPQKLRIEVKKPYRLDTGAIIAPIEITPWLNLNSSHIETTDFQDLTRYDLSLTYQTFIAPRVVKTFELPGLKLQLSHGEEILEWQSPNWHFTQSPLRPVIVEKQQQGEYFRPELRAPRLPVSQHQKRLELLTAIFILLGVIALYRYRLLPFIGRKKIFSSVRKKLRNLANHPVTPQSYQQALTEFHHGFNQFNGCPLYASQLNQFLNKHHCFKDLETEIAQFFDCSQKYLFAGAPLKEQPPIKKWIELATQLRKQEVLQ